MDNILSFVTADPTKTRQHKANSISDRLSSTFTASLLLGFAFFIVVYHLFDDDPVQCWCPAHFEDSMVDYTNKVCWTSNTYYLPYSERIQEGMDDREYVNYYQWVPLVLAFQAVAFMAPGAVWMVICSFSGITVASITDIAMDCTKQVSKDERKKRIEYMVEYLDRFLSTVTSEVRDKLRGYFLPVFYLLTKCLYLANAIGQLYLLNAVLGDNYNLYGIDIISKLIKGDPWKTPSRFPRVTLCDVTIRRLGNLHRYTVQCSMHMNLYNEIIYIFLWFWFVLVAAFTAGSFLSWLLNLTVPCLNEGFIRRRLHAMKLIGTNKDQKANKEEKHKNVAASVDYFDQRDVQVKIGLVEVNSEKAKQKEAKHEHKDVKEFVSTYLRGDGCFILRMVKINSSDMIASELIAGLWTLWHAEKYGKKCDRNCSTSSTQTTRDDCPKPGSSLSPDGAGKGALGLNGSAPPYHDYAQLSDRQPIHQ